MFAQQLLHPRDAGAKAAKSAQAAPATPASAPGADLGRRRLRQRRQRNDGLRLVHTRQALQRGVLHHQHAPGIGQRQPRQQGRRRAVAPGPPSSSSPPGRSRQCRCRALAAAKPAASVALPICSPCQCAKARPMASASCVPEPKPACAGSTCNSRSSSPPRQPVCWRSRSRWPLRDPFPPAPRRQRRHGVGLRGAQLDHRLEAVDHQPRLPKDRPSVPAGSRNPRCSRPGACSVRQPGRVAAGRARACRR